MSAKTERELRKKIAECDLLCRQNEKLKSKLHSLELSIEEEQACREDLEREIIAMKKKVRVVSDWRKDHIVQDMVRRKCQEYEREERKRNEQERKTHICRIRKTFGVASGISFLLLLGITGSFECNVIPFGLAVPGMILCACAGFVFACKAGLMVWE